MKAEYRQEIERRESRFIESAGFRRLAPKIGISLAVSSIVVEFGVLLASSLVSEVFRVTVSACAFASGIFGIGLVLLATIPHQITMDMRKTEILDSIASQCDELTSRIERTIAEEE